MASFMENYEPVADRLARAHADHPTLRVITDLVHVQRTEDGKPVQYIGRAQIYIGDVLKAQDYAEEIVGSSLVNKTSALENCLTSAIGRALADMGYQGSLNGKAQRPSREEMQKVARAEEVPTAPQITAEQLSLAQEALDQIPQINKLPELEMFYNGAKAAGLLQIPINGLTVNKSIMARKAVLEKALAGKNLEVTK